MANKQKPQKRKAPPEQRLLWSASDLSVALGCSRSRIFEMIASGLLPESFKLGGARKWRKSDILRWIELSCPCLEKYNQLTKRRGRV